MDTSIWQTVIEAVGRYWGMDWIAIIATVLGMWMLSGEKRSGFIVYGVGAVAWVMMGWMTQSWGMLLGNAAFVVVNARGYLKWGSGDKGMGTNGK